MTFPPYRQAKQMKGFSLIELLLVLAVITALLAITIFAINPQKHFTDTRDSQREVDLLIIVQALYQYSADHEGSFPNELTTELLEVCRQDAETCTGLHDLSVLTTNQSYLIEMPSDPQCDELQGVCSSNGTGYYLQITSNGRVYIAASSSENTDVSIIQ